MIHVESLTKRHGSRTAVNSIDFDAEPGRVTGFLGPNGAGKSTTLRMIVGLDHPTSGRAEVNGQAYRDSPAPLLEVGALLDAKSAHRNRTAYKHLLAIAATHRIGRRRVHEVMGIVGIEDVAHKRVGEFSLGMGQRLGIATALLGDPGIIILDEPINGLDPDGILWVRGLLRDLASENRTVLLSSHLMGEMAQTADDLVIIGKGRILARGPMQEIIADVTESVIRVRAADAGRLIAVMNGREATVAQLPDGSVEVTGLDAQQVAEAASAAGLLVTEITERRGSLEDAYLALTAHTLEYSAAAAPAQEGP